MTEKKRRTWKLKKLRRCAFDPETNTICCKKCKIVKPADLDHFGHDKRTSHGWQAQCRACVCEYNRTYFTGWRKNLREETLRAYGGDKPACACCGETHVEFLTLDHPENDGAEDRRSRKKGSFYYSLKQDGFPPGLIVLCYNCNCSFGRYGYCPHHPEIRRPVALPGRRSRHQNTTVPA